MMWLLAGNGNRLGLALGERDIRLAEVESRRHEWRVYREAVMPIPPQAGWDKPELLGRELQRFLQTQGFRCRTAVVGLPGRWLLVKTQAIPPLDEASALSMLRLSIERTLPGQEGSWIAEFAAPSAAGATSVAGASREGVPGINLLLAAMPRQRYQAIQTVLKLAGIKTRAITATSLAMWQVMSSAEATGAKPALVYGSPEGIELVLGSGRGEPLGLDQLTSQGEAKLSTAMLAGGIRRSLTRIGEAAQPTALCGWCTSADGSVNWQDLAQLLSMPVLRLDEQVDNASPTRRSPGGQTTQANKAGHTGLLDAQALARAASVAGGIKLDFLRDRLAQVAPGPFTRSRIMTAAALAALLLIGAYFAWDYYSLNRSVADLQQQLKDLNPRLVKARADLDRLTYVRGWYDQRPPFLECLRSLTTAFPTGGAVWTTSLAIRDDMTGTLAGKSQDEQSVFELMDRLKASRRFTQVKLLYARQAERGSRVVSFAMTFTFTPAKD